MGDAGCLDGELPNLSESGAKASVFNGIAFCYECHISAGDGFGARGMREVGGAFAQSLGGGDLACLGCA